MRRRLLYHSSMHSGSAHPLHGIRRLSGLTRLNALYALVAPGFRWGEVFKKLIPASRPKFHVKMIIHHLNNVPLVSGQVFIKWHLKDSVHMRARGKSPKVPIKNHKVIWNYEFSCFLSMKIDKHQHLSESWIIFEVNQESSELSGASHQLVLGKVDINLAEYAGLSKETECYLLQNSKVNSLLRISISMEQIGGSTNYIINPPQKKQMFYGIADLMSKHNNMNQEKSMRHLDDLSLKKLRNPEFFMYEDNMVANMPYLFDTFHSFEIIENIFNEKDKWLGNPKKNPITKEILDNDKREIKTAQDWEIKELEYGVCWSLNRSSDKLY
ncbi:uncharacterized protein T551_00296 [Pneumocystis jirovecii RU7]|uniref:C2 NT-type domain-containing protein n=1 Tax=Pneumocystis jirovecii (strain RU7) TaxID=1408657 RepID=A0A0W4ZWP3_PNEJ7|nr:uncharacterized protein T551_00296 [Pneumocystis jirovecii RU7]KTW32811.1 hypothetical protein T551_00296 [Pneumocystis jirovecii RU7]